MYGTQAASDRISLRSPFENDVKMYGTQADVKGDTQRKRLRMM